MLIKVFRLQKQQGENTLKYNVFNMHILKSSEPFCWSDVFLSLGYVSLGLSTAKVLSTTKVRTRLTLAVLIREQYLEYRPSAFHGSPYLLIHP